MPALDGLRGIAILAVLFAHATPLLNQNFLPDPYLAKVFHFGAYGVDLFFVLSGFLITGILIDTKQSPSYFKTFFARRFLRLFPVYYGYLMFVFLVLPNLHRLLHTSMPQYTGSWLPYLTYLSNWKPGHGADDSFLGHFWSLAVEEQFYIVWPFLLFLIPARYRIASFCLTILCAWGFRLYLIQQGADWNTIYRLTPARMDSLAMGALAAALIRSENVHQYGRHLKTAGWIGGITFLGCAAIAGDWTWKSSAIQAFGSLGIEVAFTAVVFAAAGRQFQASWINRLLESKVLGACGKVSYGMYVYHIALYVHFAWLWDWTRNRLVWLSIPIVNLAAIALMMLSVYGVAVLSWRFFESPLLAIKARLRY